MDNQIIRRAPNYFCHKAAYLYMSSAIVRGESTDTKESIPDDMKGQDLKFKYIHTYRVPGVTWE